MRSQSEMFALIMDIAVQDEHVRAVTMNGSRADPGGHRDRYQDYDIVYIVDDIERYERDHGWLRAFGEELIFQFPDRERPADGGYGFLMQFADGNRIDLQVQTLAAFLREWERGEPTLVLLDKDLTMQGREITTDAAYWVKKPDRAQYDHCVNEFWWVLLYVAKGLCRGDVLYAMETMNRWVRPQLLLQLTWLAGEKTGWRQAMGKCGDKLRQVLPEDVWRAYLTTYAPAETESLWAALFALGEQFGAAAVQVAKQLGFDYPTEQAKRVAAYARTMRENA